MPSASVVREGDVVRIDNVPPLAWGKTGENTFCGALAAALAPLGNTPVNTKLDPKQSTMALADAHAFRPAGPDFDYLTLMGTTALAFRTRWCVSERNDKWVGAVAVGELPEEIALVEKAAGISLEEIGGRDGDDNGRAAAIKHIVASIDAGEPVLGYIKPNFDMGVFYGYRDGGAILLARNYYKPDGPDERPAADADSYFLAIRHVNKSLPPPDAARIGIKAAINNWSRDDRPKFEDLNFVYGSHAFDQWIADLKLADTMTDENKLKELFRVSWWNMNSYNDARWAAAGYLRGIAPMHDGRANKDLLAAADIYEKAARRSGEVFWKKECFLGPWSGKQFSDWNSDVRTLEIKMLTDLKALDERANEELKKAIDEW